MRSTDKKKERNIEMFNQNGYLQNPYGFTPFVTKDTNTEAVRVFQGDEMVQQLSQLNNSMGAYMQQTEKRFQDAERKKRRKCTQKYLSVGMNGVIVLVEAYDDGTMESKNFFTNVSGSWNVYRTKFAYTEEMSPQYAIKFASGLFVMGNAYKNTEAAIYRNFIMAGVKFDPGNSLATIKRVLYETYSPAIKNCICVMTVPELAGWYNKKFRFSNSNGMACPKDFLDMPIFDKTFVQLDNRRKWQGEFVGLLKNIREINTGISCITILTAGIMASIFRQHGMLCENFINFVMLDTTVEKQLLQFFAVFNRQSPTVISLDGTAKCIAAILATTNDEVVITDALSGESAYEKQKIDKNLYLLHKKIIDAGNAYQINRDINATMVVMNRQISVLRGAINIFMDKDFWFSGEQTMESVTWFIAAFVNYVEENYDNVEYTIERKKEEACTVLQITWILTQMFFEEQGIDIEQELQMSCENPFKFLGERLCDIDELLRLFVEAVREAVPNYYVREKVRNVCFNKDSIYITDEKVWISTKILLSVLSEHGLYDNRKQILLELKNRGKLYTDSEGLSMKVQIGEVRREAYVFDRNLFELSGYVPFDSLGKECE